MLNLFGCNHQFGFPLTPKRNPGLKDTRPTAAQVTGTYVVCTECGQEFAYDWERMKVLSNREARKLGQTEGNPQFQTL